MVVYRVMGTPARLIRRQLPVEDEEQRRYAADENSQLKGAHHAEVDEHSGALYVVGDHRHEVAGVSLIVECEAQPLHPLEQVVLQGVGDPRGYVFREVGLPVAERAAHYADEHQRNAQENQAAPVPVRQHLVDGVADQPGDGKG